MPLFPPTVGDSLSKIGMSLSPIIHNLTWFHQLLGSLGSIVYFELVVNAFEVSAYGINRQKKGFCNIPRSSIKFKVGQPTMQ